MITVEGSTIYDPEELATRLRPEDVREVEALGVSPLDALTSGVYGRSCYTVWDDQEPLAMFGVVTSVHDLGIGHVWLLASPALFERATYQFLRESRRWLAKLEEGYFLLHNIADPRNERHIAWLRWLGFTFIKHRFGLGLNGETYIEFVKPCASPPPQLSP